MNTAVIITGQARTFAKCFKAQREAVFRKLENPHFFLSLARWASTPGNPGAMPAGTDYGPTLQSLLDDHPGRVFIEWVDQPEMPEADRARFELASEHAPWFRSVPVEGIWKQFWHLARGWDFYRENATTTRFERFVRIRPDIYFHNWTMPEVKRVRVEDENHLSRAFPAYRFTDVSTVFAPWWGSWGGCPDRFAYIVGVEAAAQYFNVFHRINELLAEGCAYHPETMLQRALERAGVRVSQTMDAEFTTIRMKGDKRPHDSAVYSNRDVLNYVNARLAEASR